MRPSERIRRILVVLSLVVTISFPAANANGQDGAGANRDNKPSPVDNNSSADQPAPFVGNNGESLSHKAQRELTQEYVSVFVSVLAPQNVADIFGRRIAHRYVAFQVTIRNESRDHQFLLQNIGLDMSYISRVPGLAVDPVETGFDRRGNKTYYHYEPSSTDLSLLRGISEKGQNYDPRNFILRLMRGAGTIAAGLIGVTTFGSSYAPGVAVFNGPLITAYTDTFRDSTINQLIRLSDSAYQTNVLVPRQGSKVMVAFVDQATFMNSSYRKQYYKDPMKIADEIDFRKAIPVIYGMLITEVLDQPATLTGAFIDDDQKKLFLKTPVKVAAYIIGRNLTGAQLSLENKPDNIDVEMDGPADTNRLNFFIKSQKLVRNDQTLHLLVRKANEVTRTNLPLTYVIDAPILDPITDKVKPGNAVTVTLKGSNFFKDITEVKIEGSGVEKVSSEVQSDGKSIKVTLKITNDGVGSHNVTVNNGTGLTSLTRTLTVEANQS